MTQYIQIEPDTYVSGNYGIKNFWNRGSAKIGNVGIKTENDDYLMITIFWGKVSWIENLSGIRYKHVIYFDDKGQ